MDLNVRTKTYKTLWGKLFPDLGFGKGVLDMTLKAWAKTKNKIKQKKDQLNFMKIRNFTVSKETIKQN